MDIQYHYTNKIYIGECIQVHDQNLSSKCGSGSGYNSNLGMKGWIFWRRHESVGLLRSVGR